MNPRVRPILVATAVTAGLLALTGCGLLTPDGTAEEPPTAGSPVLVTPTGAAPSPSTDASEGTSGTGSVKDSGDLPDVCTLLSDAEVESLTGRDIVQIDRDGASPGSTTRYCQWQQSSGQLAVFLSRIVGTEFSGSASGGEPVDGLGDDAYLLSGHLFVEYGAVMIDVYARGGSDAGNLAEARDVVEALIPRI